MDNKIINIENILNAPVISEPWHYQCIDNVLDEKFLEKLTDEVLKFGKVLDVLPTDQDGIWLYKALELGMSKEIVEAIMDINRQILKIAPKLLGKYANNKKNESKIGYFSIPRLGYCTAKEDGELHDDGDSNDKAMILVIYLYPEESLGTKLYTANDENTLVKEIEWKRNRAFLFTPIKDVTWHKFKSEDQKRITLNFYYERYEDMSYIRNLSPEKIKWFYDNFANDALSIELKDL